MSNKQPTPPEIGPSWEVGRATGFELASRGPSTAGGIESALERNRAFAAAAGHEGAVVFPSLRLFVITCLDPRVDPAHFLGLGLSDAMVLRNVGGRVTPEVINDIVFIGQLTETALPDGPLFEIAVIHHTQCGTGALADDTFRRRYAQRIGAEESTLLEHAVLDPAATVTRDVERLRSTTAISPRSPSPGTSTTSSRASCRRLSSQTTSNAKIGRPLTEPRPTRPVRSSTLIPSTPPKVGRSGRVRREVVCPQTRPVADGGSTRYLAIWRQWT